MCVCVCVHAYIHTYIYSFAVAASAAASRSSFLSHCDQPPAYTRGLLVAVYAVLTRLQAVAAHLAAWDETGWDRYWVNTGGNPTSGPGETGFGVWARPGGDRTTTRAQADVHTPTCRFGWASHGSRVSPSLTPGLSRSFWPGLRRLRGGAIWSGETERLGLGPLAAGRLACSRGEAPYFQR